MSPTKHKSGGPDASPTTPGVLIVGDDPIVREAAGDVLQQNGFAVLFAADGQHALSLIEAHRPDLILLNAELPELDGYDTCQRLRATPQGEHVPIIMMTRYGDVHAAQRAFDVKATDFVSKPVDWTVFVQRIHYALRASSNFLELKRSQQRLLSAQKMAHLGYWDWDMVAGMLYLSDKALEIIGHSVETCRTMEDYVGIVYEEDREQFLNELNRSISSNEAWLLEHRVVTVTGEVRTVKTAGETSFTEARQEAAWSMGTMLDVTEQRRNEATIQRMAFFDDVTGLHNRVAFMEELKVVINLHQRLGSNLGVLYLDLDDFKRINDSMGHQVGDQLLREFSERLVENLRACDIAARSSESSVLARLGGDEFILLLSGLKNKTDATIVARRILDNLTQPFVLNVSNLAGESVDHEVYIGASIGIAVYPDDGKDADELLKNADTAMYAAKQAGKNTHRYYVDLMNKRALERLDMESRLRGARARDELLLYYQPQVDLLTGDVIGLEALLRWQSPELGFVMPGDFISLAEETGQMIAIGAWVLEEACRQTRAWRDSGLATLKIAVNVSSLQFRQGKFEDTVARILERTGLAAECLELELTESIVMNDVEQSIATLYALKAMGVMISIDDFGTGYSSLSYLQRFPVDTLKIDRSFVRGVGINGNNTAITNAIIAMAQSLGFDVVAEGVEDEHQLIFLLQKNCQIAQGYLFSKPFPSDRLPGYLEQLKVDQPGAILRWRQSQL